MELWSAEGRNLDIGVPLPQHLLEDERKQPRSLTPTETEFIVFGSDEQLRLPVYTSTQVWEVKRMFAGRLGIEPHELIFMAKQGCSWRKQVDTEEVNRKVVIKGIKSFTRQRKVWDHPMVIIGTGHAGLKQAMWYLKHKETNFILYDRKPEVGGTSWWDQANTTSKLQTELGAYHLQYDEANPVPTNLPPWPTRDQLLAHFKEVSEQYGIMPYCRFNTDVLQMTIEKGDARDRPQSQWWTDQDYRLTLRKDGVETEVLHSTICYYPGNLSCPREETYKGEDVFVDAGGLVDYAICNNTDYNRVTGQEVALIGHGAFAVENVRTCCEHGVKKIWLVCRRKNLACPRVCSWLINQSKDKISGPLYMKATLPMYALTPFDPWTYHSVHANAARTHLTITQKARFGIGDVYFLAIAMGVLEVIEDRVKRLSPGLLHLESGRRLDVAVVFKLLGFTGAWEVDRLLAVKEMTGFWVGNDFRRYLNAEAIGVNANNFSGTSFSPGVRGWVQTAAHFFWYPKDFKGVQDSGMLPSHKAEPDEDRPAYVLDARMATGAMMVLGSCAPALGETMGTFPLLKHWKQWECHPMKLFVQQCKDEWDEYARTWKENGAPGPVPAYPYTPEMVQGYLDEEQQDYDALLRRIG